MSAIWVIWTCIGDERAQVFLGGVGERRGFTATVWGGEGRGDGFGCALREPFEQRGTAVL